jgi:predicted anti-sigma-YlaC factor YlaD
MTTVDCLTCREALSARLDGEPEPVAVERTDDHLRTCAGCQAWHLRATELTRSLRVRVAVAVPDLTEAIMATAPVHAPAGWRARGALVGVASAQVALGLSQLFGATTHHGEPVIASHLFNESTAWNLALGIGMFWAAFRPKATSGLIPVLAGFVVLLVAYSTHDLIAGTAPVPRVVGHGLLVVGLCLMIAVNRQQRAPAPDGARRAWTPAHASTVDTMVEEPVEVAGPAGRPHLQPAGRHRAA